MADKEDDQVSVELNQPVTLTFSTRYLVSFSKATPLASSVTLSLKAETPLGRLSPPTSLSPQLSPLHWQWWSTGSVTWVTSDTTWPPRSEMMKRQSTSMTACDLSSLTDCSVALCMTCIYVH